MTADQLFIDAEIVGYIVGDGETLQPVGDALDSGRDKLEGLHSPFYGVHVEFLARAIGQPMKIGGSFFQPATVDVGSVLFDVFVGIQVAFELKDAYLQAL